MARVMDRGHTGAARAETGTVFILGPARSGTTLLYKGLCLHPEIAFISNWSARFPRLSRGRGIESRAPPTPFRSAPDLVRSGLQRLRVRNAPAADRSDVPHAGRRRARLHASRCGTSGRSPSGLGRPSNRPPRSVRLDPFARQRIVLRVETDREQPPDPAAPRGLPEGAVRRVDPRRPGGRRLPLPCGLVGEQLRLVVRGTPTLARRRRRSLGDVRPELGGGAGRDRRGTPSRFRTSR